MLIIGLQAITDKSTNYDDFIRPNHPSRERPITWSFQMIFVLANYMQFTGYNYCQ